MKRLVFGSISLCGVLLATSSSAADPSKYSPYERETIESTLRDRNLHIDAAPEGKTVEGIDVVPLEVFEKRDPVPGFVNVFHATSRRYIIERQVLQPVGEPYSQALVDETARNLRNLAQLSLVLCIPVQGSAPDRVRLVVITKDVWSLRMGFDLVAGQYGLQELLLEPTESNLAGTQQLVLARFHYLPNSYSLGAAFYSPRVQGRWMQLGADANVIINKNSGNPEGSYGTIGAARPLFSAGTEWAWGVSTTWRDEVLRRYINAVLAKYNASDTPQVDGIPYEYRVRQYIETLAVTRSFGHEHKTDVSFGAEMNLRAYNDADDLSAFDPVAVAQFNRAVLPVSDTRVGPFAQIRHYENKFAKMLDEDTLALQEDYRIGFDAWARVYPVLNALGSSRDFVGTYEALQYGAELGDGFVRGSAEFLDEFQFGKNDAENRVSDASVSGSLRIVTPRLGFGRLVFDASAYNRYRNYLNEHVYLGGDSRLRGYPTQFEFGKDFVVSNLEFRSKSIGILGCQIGGALFYDVGSAFDGYDHLRPYDGAGFGLRALFPQFDRVVFRADVGFPLVRPLPALEPGGPAIAPVALQISFRQAFPMPDAGALPASVPQAVDASGQTYSGTVVVPSGTPGSLGVLGQ